MFISQMCNIVLNSLDSSARRLLEVSKNTIINLNYLSWKLRTSTQSILCFYFLQTHEGCPSKLWTFVITRDCVS